MLRTGLHVGTRPWRPRNTDDVLPDMRDPFGARRPGEQRCVAIGLHRGDCPHPNSTASPYCYYHEKVVDGDIEAEEGLYPVWPLPSDGYVFLDQQEEVAA